MKLRVTCVLVACLALTSATAGAQMSEGERKAAARAAYTEGVTFQDKGNPAEALARFEAAQKLFDAPTHLLHIAECQVLTGKLVEASETYETLIRKPLGKDAPDAFVQAQEQGKAELAQLRPRIPMMRVVVKPEPQTLQNLTISMNDRQMPTELVGIARPVNPGPYRVSATANGWATPAPVEVEVKEREPKTIELVLQQGAAPVPAPVPAPVVVVPPGTGARPAPPEQPKPEAPKDGPSQSGLLFGVRPGVFVPVGDVSEKRKFDSFAQAGPGVGIDLIGRVARMFLVGGTLELASLGPPDAKTIPAGTRVDVSTSSIYLGVLAGIMPNVDKVTFVADAGAGFRTVSQTRTVALVKDDETLSGFDLSINAGVSIPAGPIRLVPKAGVAFGQFSSRTCNPLGGSANTNCVTSPLDSASHTMLSVALGVYYHLDFSKKSGSASNSPFFTTASAR